MAQQPEQRAPSRPHAVIVPSPGLGHLIPLTQLANQLVLRHNLSLTLLIPRISSKQPPAQKAIIDSLDPHLINVINLPQVELNELDAPALVEAKIVVAFTKSMPFICDAFRSLATKEKLVALVVDFFGTDLFDLAAELGVSRYLCHLSPTTLLPLLLSLPELDRTVGCEFRDMVGPVRLPGSVSVHGKDFPGMLLDRKNKNFEKILNVANRARTCEGIILNDYYDLQPEAIKALEEGEFCSPPVFPVGPLVSSGLEDCSVGSGCLEWLDRQAAGSVLYVSFGSGGTLSRGQVCELAFGLEMSKQKFLWVVRATDEKTSSGAFFGKNDDVAFDFLPDGFRERTRGVGLVVANWAPQARVLRHGSVGGFITHCGWNSVLEGIVNGVGLIAWPLYAEQRLNAVVVVEGLGVGLRAEAGINGVVGKEEAAKVVGELMEGEGGLEVRRRMLKLKEAAQKAVGPEGSSTESVSRLAQKWMEGGGAMT